MADLVFVADVHLVEDDVELPAFIRFLHSLPGNTDTCIIVGDLFNVWIAKRRFVSPGQDRVLSAIREVAGKGVTCKYVEGNRDYFVGENWRGDPFEQVATTTLTETIGPVRLLVTHGDLVNAADRPYRVWRAFSRSVPVRAALGLIPARTGRKLANNLERRLRGTNRRHKSLLPVELLEDYGRQAVASGHAGVVLGHFHRELELRVDGGRVWVLPDWREGRRYLRFSPDGFGRFVSAEAPSGAASATRRSSVSSNR